MKSYIFILSVLFSSSAFASYVENMPFEIHQPNSQTILCYVTGDEFYSRVHDAENYTIVQNETNGYYCYAELINDELVPTVYKPGVNNPFLNGLAPGVDISLVKKLAIISNKKDLLLGTNLTEDYNYNYAGSKLKSIQNMHNIVVYIKFADSPDFLSNQSSYTSMYNSSVSGENSVKNFYLEASYGQLNITSSFYPTNNGTTILCYQDSHNRNYFEPQTVSNPNGYTTDFYTGNMAQRTQQLFQDALDHIEGQVPSGIDLDADNDGRVDSFTFITQGANGAWGDFLWPHRENFYITMFANNLFKGLKKGGCQLLTESFMGENNITAIVHELGHILGMPDLYNFDYDAINTVGKWDLMAKPSRAVHMNAFMKHYYLDWIPSVPEITESGTYTLNPLTSSTNNCFKIPMPDSYEYIMVEYRKNVGVFESNIPGEGLIFYKVNEYLHDKGNTEGVGASSCLVYIYRFNGTETINGDLSNAHFSANSERTEFHNLSNPYPFYSKPGDGGLGNIYIKNITSTGTTMSFDIRFCTGDDITISSSADLKPFINASNQVQTLGNVIIQNNQDVSIEAQNKIELNSGFKIENGGVLIMNTNGCGQ